MKKIGLFIVTLGAIIGTNNAMERPGKRLIQYLGRRITPGLPRETEEKRIISTEPQSLYEFFGISDVILLPWELKSVIFQQYFPDEWVVQHKLRQDEVYSAVFSPDSTRLITIDSKYAGRVLLWDVNTAIELAQMDHDNRVTSATFSPDNTLIVTTTEGYDAAAHLWNLKGKELARMDHEIQNAVNSAAFSPNGQQIVTASQDTTARLWNLKGEELARMDHEDSVNSAVFDPDGQKIVTASRDNTARLWDLAGIELARMEHDTCVNSAVFSPDGQTILTASDDGTARLWNLAGNELVRMKNLGYVDSAIFSPNGKFILTTTLGETARLFNLEGKLLTIIMGSEYPVNSATFNPDGTRILTAARDGTIRIWDLEGNQRAGIALYEYGTFGYPVESAAFSPDGKHIAAIQGNDIQIFQRKPLTQGDFEELLINKLIATYITTKKAPKVFETMEEFFDEVAKKEIFNIDRDSLTEIWTAVTKDGKSRALDKLQEGIQSQKRIKQFGTYD